MKNLLTIPQTIELALQYHQAGNLSQADSLYRQVLQKQPDHSDALHLLGLIAHQAKNYEAAISFIQKAIHHQPTVANYHLNLGLILTEQGQLEAAKEALQRALTLNPQEAQIYLNLGNVLYAQKQLEEAITCYQRALTLNPNLAKAYNNLGNVLSDQGRREEAIRSYQQAIHGQPDFAEAYHNLGVALKEQGNLPEAVTCFQQAVKLNPKFAVAYRSLGMTLKELNQMAPAILCLKQAVALGETDVIHTLANLLHLGYQLTEAIEYYQRALALKPQAPQTIYDDLGMAQMASGEIPTAITYFEQADTPTAWSHLLFTLHYSPIYDRRTIFLKHQQFNARYALTPFSPPNNSKEPTRKLKIGYVSADFYKHSVSYFIEPILAHHHRDQFEIFGYYNNTTFDEVTQRLKDQFDHFSNCVTLDDEALALKIRQDRIDILVDLTGHFPNHRLLAFTKKPAPIQVTYLGYPDTTGLTSIDYRIVDNYTEPEGAEEFSSETLIRLPYSYFCYRPYADSPPIGPLPVLQNGYVTFGSFNNYAKLSRPLLTYWAQVLQAVPRSKLLVKVRSLTDPHLRQSLQNQLTQLGIDPSRLILKPYLDSLASHLEAYSQVDVALDSYPYHGATTTCETLWMGTPVVTLVGDTQVARMGLSILTTVGRPELIAQTPEEYVNICVRLANDVEYLKNFRQTIRTQMQTSPLMAAPAFTHHLETVYRYLWEKWCLATTGATTTADDLPKRLILTPEQALQLGQQFYQAKNFQRAEQLYRQVLQIEPTNSDALYSLGLIGYHAGEYEEAILLFKQAIQADSTKFYIYSDLGTVFSVQGKFNEAIDCYRQALHLNPQDALAHCNLGHELLKSYGQAAEAASHFRQALEINPHYLLAHSNLLLTLHYLTDCDTQTLFREHQKFQEQQAAPLLSYPPHHNDRTSQRPLKIGYVSQDFHRHSVSYFIEPILAHHDHQQFKIVCYYSNAANDEMTQQLRQYADTWVDCAELSDEELAEKIREARIDILVDLMGHTGKNRILVFARKPAPIQVTYLGYSNTTGLTSIDYHLTDNLADPVGVAEALNSETLVRMPHTYFCYRPFGDTRAASPQPPPVVHRHYITFGAFNFSAKLNPTILTLWAQILQAVPHSKLLVKPNRRIVDLAVQQELQTYLENFGITPDRLVIANFVPSLLEHFSTYQQVDIALDTYPYNGATTTCEALWMGVPVVTLVGDKHISRMGLSILSAVGLPELITYTPQEYVKVCVNLANDIEYLKNSRALIRAKMQASPLMDAVSFTHQLETHYRKMWEQWCHQPPPEPVPETVSQDQNLAPLLQTGQAYQQAGQWQAAQTLYRQVLQTAPEHATAWYLLGLSAAQLGDYQTGLEALQQAIRFNCQAPSIYTQLGTMFTVQRQVQEACDCYQQALAVNPNDAIAHHNLAIHWLGWGHVNEAISHLEQALTINPKYAKAHSNLLFALNYEVSQDRARIFAEYQKFDENYVPKTARKPYLNSQQWPRPLKIGYLSQDFCKHSIIYFIEPILAHHDRDHFKIVAYHNNACSDEVTQRLQRYADQFCQCFTLSDEALVEQIRQDKIDILVDLTGHMGHHRMLVLAQKPAPVQVTYLGYSNTTGLSSIDYRIVDNYSDPTDEFNAETLVRMPHSYFCFQPSDETLACQIQTLPALQQGYLTFGSFNKLPKLNPRLLSCWAQILKRVPHSRLVIKAKGLEEAHLQAEFKKYFAELESERISLLGYTASMEAHLHTYHQIDIVLDSYPYNGATTTCEALWMGVPVVTWVGERSAARMGLSILMTVGFPELIANSSEEYVNLSVKLANDKVYLKNFRQTSRALMQASPLMDATSFTYQLEMLYRNMWENWRKQN